MTCEVSYPRGREHRPTRSADAAATDWSVASDTDLVRRMSNDSNSLRDQLRRGLSPRYEVGEEIGRGGMAFVYRGRDVETGQAVAFKVLRRDYATLMGPARFLREIRLLSQLHHPGILPLLDSGHIDDLFYFLMPLVEGETLEARLKHEPQLTLETVRSIVTQIASALDYAHDAGVIHRDIKPSNIFLSGGRVLVADFGIAKDLIPREGDSTTSTDVVVGTVLYMCPEQADGRTPPDRRADVYSLGAVTYQMLAGEPPFTGPSTQAVLARVRSMPAPSAKLLRPELPRGVDSVVRKALAKSPADRYQRAGDLARALTDPAELEAAAREAGEQGPPPRRWLVPAALLLALVLVAAFVFRPTGRVLGPNKVMVFPLGETPPGAMQEGTGVTVALMLGSALEYTEPLEWIDALPRLDPQLKGDPGRLTASEARRIARAAGARWYLDGTAVRRGDSVTVILRLNDTEGDSVVGRASATRITTEAAQAGLEAVNQLLPRLLAPGQRMGDLSALAGRRPAAVAAWLQGEREYRSFNFARALEFQRRAVELDSQLAVAAIRGAQAASWPNDMVQARALADVALRHVTLLPGRMAPFARGLQAYVSGRADSAVYWLTQVLKTNPEWTEAHMALGEVYYHLLPTHAGPLDSLAEREFTAAAADPGFSPARFHLAELAIRSGDTTRARRAVDAFLRLAQDDPSRDQRSQLLLMLDCARSGRSAVDWPTIAAKAPVTVLSAAKMLAGGGAFVACAEDGFRAVLGAPDASLGDRWGAFLGLQGILAAETRTSELRGVVDSAVGRGLGLANQLYVLNALAGVAVDAEAREVAAQASPSGGQTPPFALWLAGEWKAHAGDRSGAAAIQQVLAATAVPGTPSTRYADALSARLTLFTGDTATAITRLRTLLGSVVQDNLDWGVGQSLAPERLLLAELLLARGQPREAISVAATFDSPVPAVFLPYLPASLALRNRAAMAMGQGSEAQRYQRRLAALGASHPSGSSAPSTAKERP